MQNPEPTPTTTPSASRRSKRSTRRLVWTVIFGRLRSEIPSDVFKQGLYNGLIALSKNVPRLGHIREDLVATINKANGRLEYRLREIPEVEPHTVKSWWPGMVERQGLYAGFQ